MSELNTFIGLTEPVLRATRYGDEWATRGKEGAILSSAQVVEQIMERVLPNWTAVGIGDGTTSWSDHRAAAQRALTQLHRADEIEEKLGESAPQLGAQRLHPWVWEAAKPLWRNGHYREAVGAAARQVNAEAQTKVGRRDLSEWKLFNEAFSLDPPAPGRPRLRIVDDDGGDTYKNTHQGAMSFARGCYQAVRNPAAHEVLDELREHEALEQLAAFSLLARWVDSAKLERVDG